MDNQSERFRWEAEVEQALRHQPAWEAIGGMVKSRLKTALRLAGYGVDDAIELLDFLVDDIREFAQLYHVCRTAELNHGVVKPEQLVTRTDGRQ